MDNVVFNQLYLNTLNGPIWVLRLRCIIFHLTLKNLTDSKRHDSADTICI